MKIAYCSPLNPIKSGISDFSEELLMKMIGKVEIDIFYNVKPSNEEIISNYRYYDIKELDKSDIREQYDTIVYHMGNNVDYHKCIYDTFMKYPGILELHDFSLHNYLAGDTYVHNKIEEYKEIVRYSHGEQGVRIVNNFLDGKSGAPWETHALELTVNKHLIDKAIGVIVHSDMAKQMVKGIRPEVPVINIPLHAPDIMKEYENEKLAAKDKLKISNKTLVIGSFGYATRAKRILQTLDALSIYHSKNSKDFLYVIVGKVDGIDVDGKIKELGLEKNVIVTGFTELDDFKLYMSACDICMNLRYPTHGESSASLHRMLGMGKPVIVSDIGSFEEYPDEIVLKVRYDEHEVMDIYDCINQLVENKKSLKERSKKAYDYALDNCELDKNINKYIRFFEQMRDKSWCEEEPIDNTLDHLFELGLFDEEYILNYLISNKIIDIL